MKVDGPARPAAYTPPTVQLGLAPELAALALLEAALDVTGAALLAAQPELLVSQQPSTRASAVVVSILDHARTLVGLLHLYRSALADDPEPDQPLPF